MGLSIPARKKRPSRTPGSPASCGALDDAVSRRVLVESMCCDEARDLYQLDPAPPFAAQFAPGTTVVAVGHEEGQVSLVDTALGSEHPENGSRLFCHMNAIFDLAWVPGQQQLLTASGDQTIRLFDVRAQAELRCFRGHRASVKAVSPLDGAIFASGGRDGSICMWDDRQSTASSGAVTLCPRSSASLRIASSASFGGLCSRSR